MIDSLLDDRGRSAPLAYLQDLKVDVANSLLGVIVTHWHGDHIGGISQLLDAAPNARIVLPLTFGDENFTKFANTCLGVENIDIRPLREIVRVAERVNDEGRPAVSYASEGKLLFTYGEEATSVQLTALSPSDREVHHFLLRLSGVTPAPGVKKPLRHNENYTSVSAWLSLPNDAALLGADLEIVKAEDRGWNAVLAAPNRPAGQASVYKVAHHGSVTGHHPDIWTKLLKKDPWALISPWSKKEGLPRVADQKRISELTTRAYVTAQVSTRQVKLTGSKALASLGIVVRDTNHRVGAIRLRKALSASSEDWRIELLNGAMHFNSFVARS